MANNFLDMVKRKLDAPDQVRLTASDRALLEQTCSGLEEIKKQRESEAEALAELKALVQYNPELFAGEFEKIQASIADTLKKVESTQVSTEKAIRISASEEEYKAQKMKKKLSTVTFFCVVSFLTSLGTLAVLLLNIFGVI